MLENVPHCFVLCFFFLIPKKESNICKDALKSELQLSKSRGKYELKLTLLLFYICMFLWKNCSNECCFSLAPRNQNWSWVLLQNRDFWSCLAFPRYSNNWKDIWLENSFTKTFVLTQHQQDITQTSEILPELLKPRSHPKNNAYDTTQNCYIMPENLSNCTSVTQTFSDHTILA